MIALDLDGTLLDSDRKYCKESYAILKQLERSSVTRVIATGRSMASVAKVIPEDFPVDYLAFSSGAGVQDWKTKEVLLATSMEYRLLDETVQLLSDMKLDFMLHKEIPDNHHYVYQNFGTPNADFEKRFSIYKDVATGWGKGWPKGKPASQFLVIVDKRNGIEVYADLSQKLPNLSVVLATSPFNENFQWIEIFPKGVDKATACRWIADRTGEKAEEVIAVGNDHNDKLLLKWAGQAFVVDNALEELRKIHSVVPSHNAGGVAVAIKKGLSKRGIELD